MQATVKTPFLYVLARPFLILLFLYFATISTDLLYLKTSIFKIKLNNAIAALLALYFLFNFRNLRIETEQFLASMLIFGSFVISALNSCNQIACSGFIFFYLFNFFVYFLIPINLYNVIDSKFLLKLYFSGFLAAGIYAGCQVFFSLFGFVLPGVEQWIYSVARGQALAYEPSFYALYMTPFAIFQTTKFILQKKEERNLKDLLIATFCLLISTSTGCFFSYVALIFVLCLFSYLGIIDFSIKKLLFKSFLVFAIVFCLLWIINKDLIEKGFLKLFYSGITNHFTFQCRWRGIVNYWNIFMEHPFIGVGLGGGTTYFLIHSTNQYIDILDPDILNTSVAVPMNVTTEVFASLGLLGACSFLNFFHKVKKAFARAYKLEFLTEDEKIHLISFAASLCVVMVTLQFSQSIMRAYLWLHFGISVGYANYLWQKYRT